jgi:hypothetical protein
MGSSRSGKGGSMLTSAAEGVDTIMEGAASPAQPLKFKLKLGGPSPVEAAFPPSLPPPALPQDAPVMAEPPAAKKRNYVRKKDPAKPGPGKNWRKGIKGGSPASLLLEKTQAPGPGVAKPVEYDPEGAPWLINAFLGSHEAGKRMYQPEDDPELKVRKPRAKKATKAEAGGTPEPAGNKVRFGHQEPESSLLSDHRALPAQYPAPSKLDQVQAAAQQHLRRCSASASL